MLEEGNVRTDDPSVFLVPGTSFGLRLDASREFVEEPRAHHELLAPALKYLLELGEREQFGITFGASNLGC